MGTQIELTLKKDCRQYSDVEEVKRVAAKYSSFTQFPLLCDNGNYTPVIIYSLSVTNLLKLNLEQVNKMEPIWMLEKSKITDEMHTDFFNYLCGKDAKQTIDGFIFNLYYKTEMPISIRSIFYIPKTRPAMTMENQQSEIVLYCRKVLIRKCCHFFSRIFSIYFRKNMPVKSSSLIGREQQMDDSFSYAYYDNILKQ